MVKFKIPAIRNKLRNETELEYITTLLHYFFKEKIDRTKGNHRRQGSREQIDNFNSGSEDGSEETVSDDDNEQPQDINLSNC